jgi:hypothetical protein
MPTYNLDEDGIASNAEVTNALRKALTYFAAAIRHHQAPDAN